MTGTRFSWSYRCQLVEACKELVEGHDQLLRRALGRQAGEALDVGEQDAAETRNTRKNTTSEFGFCAIDRSPPHVDCIRVLGQSQLTRSDAADWTLRNEISLKGDDERRNVCTCMDLCRFLNFPAQI